MNGQMLGLSRLAYSLAPNRQIPSAAGPLNGAAARPTSRSSLAARIAFPLVIPHDLDFLAGIFAFGAMITFSIAHLSIIALRFREAGPAERLPRAALGSGRGRAACRFRRCSGRPSRSPSG